jgi:hypothetical protein
MVQQRYCYQNRNGVRRTIIYDDERPDRFVVQTDQDVEPILALVAAEREIMRNTGDMKFLGHVPVAVAELAVHEQWDESDWAKWWNGEGRAFRVWNPGGWV